MYWRVTITNVGAGPDNEADRSREQPTLHYSTGACTEFAGGDVTVTTSPDTVADLILAALPGVAPTGDDPDYVAWYADLMQLVERAGKPPVAYADYFDDAAGWEIGWGSGVRHPQPPEPPRITPLP